MSNYSIYTDGGSRGNPGPAGAGAVILDTAGKQVATVTQFLGQQTNNYAEYEAVVLGLQKLKSVVGKDAVKKIAVEIKMDSELVAKQLRGEYQIKEESLFPQYMKVHNLRVAYFPNITVTHIPREENSLADGLANEAMDASSGNGGLF